MGRRPSPARSQLRVYNDRSLVHRVKHVGVLTGMVFGPYGREPHALCTCSAGGTVRVRFLKRCADACCGRGVEGRGCRCLRLTFARFPSAAPHSRRASLDAKGGIGTGPVPEQDVPLSIPRKTRLYLEQTQREREAATEMHRVFQVRPHRDWRAARTGLIIAECPPTHAQRDLCKLRLDTARAFVKIITSGKGPQSYASGASVRLTALVRCEGCRGSRASPPCQAPPPLLVQLQGLGPVFRISATLENTGRQSLIGLMIAVSFDETVYSVSQPLRRLPALIPGLAQVVEIPLRCISQGSDGGDVRLTVLSGADSSVPLLSATVAMPLIDLT